MIVVRVLVFAVGMVGVVTTFSSAIRTVVVPRSESLLLQRIVFTAVRVAMLPVQRIMRSDPVRQERLMAYYAPFGLIALAITWIALITLAFTPMYWAIGVDSWREATRISGSSVTTLGFAATGADWSGTVLSVVEAVIGLILVALLISFLPTMYAEFSQREQTVAYMAVRAGTPPSGVAMLERFHRIEAVDELDEIWVRFEAFFNELSETHTSFLALPFFRSPNPARSWLTTSGAVLDAAALRMSVVDVPAEPRCALAIRAGYSALREIAFAYGFVIPADPEPTDPISVTRAEFDDAVAQMRDTGIPIVADLDQAWADFSGWRVNYDLPLIAIAGLVSAPPAPWSSDRTLPVRRPILGSMLMRDHLDRA
ncbi:MAG: hypothetical protein AAF467_25720 [Actinomycetota bacterium]